MMHSIRIARALVLGTALFGLPTPGTVVAQERETGHCPGKLEALNASYVHQMREPIAAGSPSSRSWPTSRAVRRRVTPIGNSST